MNNVTLMGRLTAEARVSGEGNKKVARFNLAVPRGKDQNGNELTDFPSVVAFGNRAEFVEKYLKKGTGIIINGYIHTGRYEKDGETIYTTDVVVNNFNFPLGNSQGNSAPATQPTEQPAAAPEPATNQVEDFQTIEEDVPF